MEDERTVGELLESRSVKPSLARSSVDPLRVELSVDGLGSGLAWMQIGPETGQFGVVGAPALRAGPVPSREGGRIVKEEQLGVAAGGHKRRASPAPELELASDPPLDAIRPADPALLVMQAAAVAVDEPSGGSGNELTEWRNSVLSRHRCSLPRQDEAF